MEFYFSGPVHGRSPYFIGPGVGQKHSNYTTNSLYSKIRKCWPLANELEQAWTGVEETDRSIISKLAQQDDCRFLLIVSPLHAIHHTES